MFYRFSLHESEPLPPDEQNPCHDTLPVATAHNSRCGSASPAAKLHQTLRTKARDAPDTCAILGAAFSASMMRALSPPLATARSGRSGSAGPAASRSSTRSSPAAPTLYDCHGSSPANKLAADVQVDVRRCCGTCCDTAAAYITSRLSHASYTPVRRR